MPAARKKIRQGVPHKVLHLATYRRLEEYLAAFAQGHFHLLVLMGPGGLGKSRAVRSVLDGKGCWIEGNATPFGMYVRLYRHRDQFVVIDDVDALYADRSGVRLLKCLCQTEEEKSVAWHSDARSLERQGIPREFTTKSRVAIIANDWRTLDKNVAALQDRGHVLLFQPSAAEVHAQAGRWFDDREIYEWFGANLHRIGEPSLRHYVRAPGAEGRRHGLDRCPGGRGREQAGPPGRRAAEERRLRQHRRAGEGVRREGRRLPGDILQLPPEALGKRDGHEECSERITRWNTAIYVIRKARGTAE
jgi:hypothetical protein